MESDYIRKCVVTALDEAEATWKTVGTRLTKTAVLREDSRAQVVPSFIPGHPSVSSDRPVVDSFIAWVIDLRESTWVRLFSGEVEWNEIGHLTLFSLGFRTGSWSGISPPA